MMSLGFALSPTSAMPIAPIVPIFEEADMAPGTLCAGVPVTFVSNGTASRFLLNRSERAADFLRRKVAAGFYYH